MHKILLILLVLISSCAKIQLLPRPTPIVAKPTEQKVDLYLSHLNKFQDQHGFIYTEHCDSLLFSALLSAARPELDIKILEARDSTGAWHRRPTHDCSPSIGNSRSTISRDMILGLFWHLWRNKDLTTAIELMKDLKRNAYKLRGQGTLGELLVNPSMMSTLAHIILKLDGPRYPVELALPVKFSKSTGFISHLAIWHILLRGELLGKIYSDELDILRYHAQRNPKNPFFQAAYHKWLDGIQGASVNLLLDATEWPSDRLPSTGEHCAAWPIQRDYTEKDWGPCTPFKEHTGMELVIIYELIIK